jgi:hypothetical protein
MTDMVALMRAGRVRDEVWIQPAKDGPVIKLSLEGARQLGEALLELSKDEQRIVKPRAGVRRPV